MRRALLEAATAEFAQNGYALTRIEDIVAKTATSKRMVYYYFTDKEGLYREVLHHAYASVREREAALQLDHLPPAQALVAVAGFTFDHHRKHPEVIRLVMIENVHRAENLRATGVINKVNAGAIAKLERILERGRADGVFRADVTPLALHWQISALAFFNVSNRPSFSTAFGDSLFTDTGQAELREQALRSILSLVLVDPTESDAILSAAKVLRDPGLEPFLALWNERWNSLPDGARPADRRKRFEAIAREIRMPLPEGVTDTEEHWVETEAGPVRVRLYRPAGEGAQPCLIYLHGGAFMMGSPETHADVTAHLAARSGHVVVSVDYALAPEAPFPAAARQVQAVAHWLHAQAGALGLDPARFAVAGDSAGGNLAAGLALALRGGPVQLRGQLLIYPGCDFDLSRPSYLENAEGPVLEARDLAPLNALYAPEAEAALADPQLRPLLAPLLADSHADLPPAYVAIAQFDPLRDAGTAYAEALRKAGVAVNYDPGVTLVHGYLHALPFSALCRDQLSRMGDWLAAL
ncbi:alpha/beta hydrolase fold domain-containing protein [Pararhodobacter sp. CCB-MM2]|uniref:alpha/beta hydrolase fold domain-containing protein n=1 Tax=Pararhodobacter sp. CCB-MM2 TaxID=1786003 RepID=UPI001F3649CF|nr:alpha/beta hydrolase fold domain-containing protein [Pararhodobacter sp. CCB-MM2]